MFCKVAHLFEIIIASLPVGGALVELCAKLLYPPHQPVAESPCL